MSPIVQLSPGIVAGRRSRRRRALATTASIALHALALVSIFGSAAGGPITSGGAGGPSGPVFSVSLVDMPDAQATPAQEAGGELQPLFARFKVAPAENAVPLAQGQASRDFAALTDRLRSREPLRPPAQSARRATSEDGASDGREGRRAHDGAAGDNAASGALWGRIAPCWRNIPSRTRVLVTLDVTLEAGGGIARPPRIIRPDGISPDEERLAAEAAALSALAACLPRNDVRLGGASYRLEFAPRR